MPPKLSNRMFLDPAVQSIITHVRLVHAKYFDFSERLNELAHRSIFDAKITKTDAQQLLLGTLIHRAISSFQACIILAERGMPSETRVILRTLLEVTFRIVAIAKDRSVGIAYIQEDELHRRKFLNKLKLLPESLRQSSDDANIEDLHRAISQRISDGDLKELKTQWFAQKAGLSDFYNSTYAVLSSSVHVNVRNLEPALRVDAGGDVAGLEYGPSDEELEINLLTAAECLIFSMRAVYSKVDVSTAAEIEAMHNEFNVLHASFANET